MATLTTVYSAQNTNAYQSTPETKLSPAELHGKLRRAYGKYTLAAADEFGTSGLINMFRLPKGATLAQAYFTCSDLGSAGTCEIGWDAGLSSLETADSDGIFVSGVVTTAVDSKSAAQVTVFVGIAAAGYNHKFLDDVNVQVKFTVPTNGGAGGTIELECWYVVD